MYSSQQFEFPLPKNTKEKRQRLRKSFYLPVELSLRQKSISCCEMLVPSVQQLTETDDKLEKNQQNTQLSKKYQPITFSDQFQIQKKIGQGTQGIVYKCRNKQNGGLKAVKMIKGADQQLRVRITNQYNLLKSLNHKNIMSVENLIIDQIRQIAYLVFEYWPYGTLEKHIRDKVMTEREVSAIVKSILQPILYLHNQLICHRDIRPQNILYNPLNGDLKLIDFQISKRASKQTNRLQMLTNTCDIRYKAPQMFNSIYNQAIDMWSLGVIVYRMLNGKFPFEAEYEKKMRQCILKQEPSYDIVSLTNGAKFFIQQLLNKKPLQRLTAKQALTHNFIQKYYKNIINTEAMQNN